MPLSTNAILAGMDKAKILTTVQTEFMRHSWDTFLDEQGVIVTGCPRWRKQSDTRNEYMRHLADDVLPPIVDLVLTLAKAD